MRTVVRQEVLDRILDGRLGPRAPVRHAELAAELGVSVTPLREALIELETEGFLEARPNRGFVVTPFSVRELSDLYALISLLECTAVRESPPAPDGLDRLEALNAELADAAGDAWRVVESDIEWHRELVAGSGNEVLKDVLARLKLRAVRYAYAYLCHADRIPRSVEQHEEIIRRLRDGDVAGAVRTLEDNWRPRVMLDWLEEHKAKADPPPLSGFARSSSA